MIALAVALDLVSTLLRTLSRLLVVAVFFLLIARGLSHFKDAHRKPGFKQYLALDAAIEKPALSVMRMLVPTEFRGSDVAGWLLIGAVYLLSLASGRLGVEAEFKSEALRAKKEGDGKALLELTHADRAKLLEIYAQTKKTLEEQKRSLAFLSIDIVNSTGMKVGEDAGIAERDFRQYKHMVEKVISENQVLKSSWTPDGVMICFPSVPDAVRAGQDVIRGLVAFNKSVKSMKTDFAVRVGINGGDVYYDDSVPMEEMSDRVIDVAGHMQKHGGVNAVSISKHSIEPYLKDFPFQDAGRVVDGCPVFEWRPAVRV